MRKQRHKKNKINIKNILIPICILAAIYFGISMFFINHFYFGSQINNINVAGKTVDEANKAILDSIDTYKLELNERGDSKEEISGSDINLKYDPKDKINELKKSQSPFLWIKSIFSKGNVNLDNISSFDEDLLKEKINNLSCVKNKNIIEPQNASFNYEKDGYTIVDEVKGNKIDKSALYENIKNAILDGDTVIDLDKTDSYYNPEYTVDSDKVKEVKDQLDKYTKVVSTYTLGDEKEVVDGSTINKWLNVDKDMNITFNEKNIRTYVDSLSSKYNTFGDKRNFKSSSGKVVQVSGGNYGWIIDKNAEINKLIETVKNGENVTRDPIYSQTAVSRDENDIGNTYVEIDLTKQHLWFYKDGALFAEGDVVTGNMSKDLGTPTGTYRLNYRERNATLKGEDYSSPVNYWMPFNGNIGLHDASWRSEFGGQIYLTSGSHGCVNAPYELAQKIFQEIKPGTPIICYQE